MYHSFVLPFCFGVLALFSIVAVKFSRWIATLDRLQKKTVWKHFFSGMLLPAVREMFLEGLLHRRVTRFSRRMGYMHRSIALGWFLLIVYGFVESAVTLRSPFHAPWTSIFFRYFVHGEESLFSRLSAHVMDLLLLYVLSGVTIAIGKSVYAGLVGLRKTTNHRFIDLIIRYSLWSIFPLRLLSESATAAIWHNGGFLTQTLGSWIGPSLGAVVELPLWTLYSLALCLFFTFMPFSRYMHIFTELLLIFFRRFGVKEAEEPTGYTKMELSACSRCGICIEKCPMDKVLGVDTIQPVYYLRDVRTKQLQSVTAENCLMCNQCQSDCPVGLEIASMRRQGRQKGELDVQGAYPYLDKAQSFNAIGRVAFFGGCMSHLCPGITESMKKIFEAAGQKYWMVDEDKTICCGRPLLQQGFLHQAAALRRQNTRLILESHARTLVTSCPICYQSFTKEYHLPIKVMHHTEYIAMLIRLGKLPLEKADLKVCYHDPCELGRGCGVYQDPRDVLDAVSQRVPAAMEGKDSQCCGYNLGNTRLSLEQQMQLRDAAWQNLTVNHPDLVATACPLCKKAFQHSQRHRVMDVAELVAQQLKK